jgi:hypothetical protein
MSDTDAGDEENRNLGQPWPEWQKSAERYDRVIAEYMRERNDIRAALGLMAGGVGLTLAQEIKLQLSQAYTHGWNEALKDAEVAVIVAPASLKTTNNLPTYYMARETVIEAIRLLKK